MFLAHDVHPPVSGLNKSSCEDQLIGKNSMGQARISRMLSVLVCISKQMEARTFTDVFFV